MNKLSIDRQKLVLSLLAEGNSIRSIERITKVNQNTVMSLLVRAGRSAQSVLDAQIQNVPCRFVELDEIWTYVGIKNGHLPPEQRDGERGDQYVFVALDAESKLVPCFMVGKRNEETTESFIRALKGHIHTKKLQISTDGWGAYPFAIARNFWNADYAQIIKEYGPEFKGEKRYSPPQVTKVEVRVKQGEPLPNHISTSYIERQNLTMRMQMRRFTRLTNAFSKKLENLVCACSLHFYHYNFMRYHETVRCTPAMAAGLTKTFWDWDVVL